MLPGEVICDNCSLSVRRVTRQSVRHSLPQSRARARAVGAQRGMAAKDTGYGVVEMYGTCDAEEVITALEGQ